MHIIAVGLNFRTAPVEIREKLSFNEQELASAMKTLSGQKSILENIIAHKHNQLFLVGMGMSCQINIGSETRE